jgi:hypothetical protein
MIRIHRRVTIARVVAAIERAARTTENPGFCLACGMDVDGVEPDARGDRCESCGAPRVYGAEEVLQEMQS